MSTPLQALLHSLVQALGPDCVLAGAQVPQAYHTDWSGAAPVVPLALVRPHSTEQVSALLRWCTAHQVALVPQGGRTGLAGAAVPVAGAVVLSLERMAGVLSLDARAGVMDVQAGASLQSVQEAAAAQGLQFGVDLGARGSCQIGGCISTNAGGNGVLQFGMMREQVLGLEVVLADGTVLPMLRPMIKNNTGYDLKHWFIGAEGTLGVVTRALLRLRPAPRARATALLALADADAALEVLASLQARFPGALSAYELMWRDFVAASLDWQGLREPFAQTHALLAVIQVDGDSEALLHEALLELLEQAMQAGQVEDAAVAQSEAQARAFWKIREATAELPAHMHPPINFDISLAQPDIGHFVEACRQALDARWPGHHSLFFGHVGDGNLHVSTDGRSIGGPEQAQQLEDLVYAMVAQYQGSVSAEHGIGLHKKPYLSASRSQSELAAMRSIKQALDPHHLLNPGKVFDL